MVSPSPDVDRERGSRYPASISYVGHQALPRARSQYPTSLPSLFGDERRCAQLLELEADGPWLDPDSGHSMGLDLLPPVAGGSEPVLADVNGTAGKLEQAVAE